MLKPLSFCVTALALTLGTAAAFADNVDDSIAAFRGSDGFEVQDAELINETLTRHFIDDALGSDGAISPIEKALVLIDSVEGKLTHARYMVRFGQMLRENTPVTFLTVERYNLGPMIHRQAVDAYGEENVDAPETFGVGPHVSWRIVTMPLTGEPAAVVEAARREIGDEEAASLDCAGRACLADAPAMEELQLWDETGAQKPIQTAYEGNGADGLAVPARAAAELAVAAGLASREDRFRWIGPEQPEAARGNEPFLFVTIDRGLGQEIAIDAMLGQTLLNDDSIAELWHRRVEFPGSVYWMQAATQRNR